MKNTIKWLGIIVFVTVIGFAMIACDDGSGGSGGGGGGGGGGVHGVHGLHAIGIIITMDN